MQCGLDDLLSNITDPQLDVCIDTATEADNNHWLFLGAFSYLRR